MNWVFLLGEAAQTALENGDYPKWITESYAVALTVEGVALFTLFGGALGLFNWTESFKPPAIWLSVMTPLIAALLPVPVLWRVLGLVTVAVATLFVGLWLYWNRF